MYIDYSRYSLIDTIVFAIFGTIGHPGHPAAEVTTLSTQWTSNHEGHLVLSDLDSSCSKCKIKCRPARGEFNRSQNETSDADGTIYHSLLLL